jgi:superfamily I DNA/RNA helicase
MAWYDNIDTESSAYKLVRSNEHIIRSIAGPGSGKSFAIKHRLLRLLEEGVDPSKLLAITFTRTAAADLKKEIVNIGVSGCEKIEVRTIHSHAMLLLIKSETKIFTQRLPRIIIEHEIDPALRDVEYPDGSSISERKDLLKLYEAAWANLQIDDPGLPRNKTEEEFHDKLIEWLVYHQGMMIGEVIPLALGYLQNNPAAPEIGKYHAILVDEYQDLNKAEQIFIHLIKGTSDIVIVGDDDQSIYGFRYAFPDGIREISNLYGKYYDISFNTIRRCPKQVTLMASALIAKNSNRTRDELVPFKKNQNGEVKIIQWKRYENEIDGIVEIIKNEIDQKLVIPGDILVLVPRRLIGYKIRDKLILQNVPAKSYFREDVIKNDLVRRAYSLIHLLANPDDKISLRYLLGYGSNTFRSRQYRIIKCFADNNSLSIRNVLDNILNGKVELKNVTNLIKEYRKILADLIELRMRLTHDPIHVFEYFYREGDEEGFYEIVSIFQNIVNRIPFLDTNDETDFNIWIHQIVSELTETISMPDSPEEGKNVRIMSLHASKGLNAKFVVMVSMIDELMPFIQKEDKNTQRTIEEQRRLFYVAMTRCRSSEVGYPGKLIISSFVWIYGIDAVKMSIDMDNARHDKKVAASRFITDFGRTSPNTILGDTLLQEIRKNGQEK